MQMFTRSPQGGKSTELALDLTQEFKEEMKKYSIKNTYVHTPYYINLASANNRIRYGSSKAIREELERADKLGAKYVMTHLGSAKDLGEKEGIKKAIEMLQKSLDGYTGKTHLLLENSAGAGMIIGASLKELGEIIKKIKNPVVAGICLDTQHSFASGYDWRDFEKTIERVDKEVGTKSIKLIHANDSQSDFDSHKDRHEHVGQGKIGREAFKNIVEFAKKNNIDMICETQWPGVDKDIKFLKSLR
jgi:deoxyribonuclease-4